MDLRDLWRGGLSYRRLWVLVKHLPPESATQTVLRDEDLDADVGGLIAPESSEQAFGPWSKADYQRAQLIDAIRENTYAVAVAGHIEPKPKPPAPTPRPGLRRQRVVSGELAEAQIHYLNQFRARG